MVMATAKSETEDLSTMLGMTVSQIVQAVGGFEGDTAAMVRASVRTAERVFATLDTCDDVIDEASATGREAAGRLRELLASESAADVATELEKLEAVAAHVRRTGESRRLMNRVLGREDQDTPMAGAGRLTMGTLPARPSFFGENDSAEDLFAIAMDREQQKPRLKHVHAQRIDHVATHLVAVVTQAAATGFADERAASESLDEARLAFDLWQTCLAERDQDLV
ncbi:hypothetical protein A6A06_35260 [Streptomyces sp. CB02923]|uniref:hypothetical protein n=1 Tax=Streptomyces sp. CB02923 TaxID=1718985 RepID=UPI00093A1EE8|nr:hypothetical protein [Streptomyces sp. CB02923]OKI08110.1 hypothetical protein A6A06_35260 [Streptomyces sp. CB02923]